MNKTIWKQLDSRWSSKPYPVSGSSFGANGCGCCACVHVAMEQEDKSAWTPENLRQWMINQGYAYYGQGTTWNGITETLKHIGHDEVIRVWDDPMSVAFAELKKGDRIGIFLFSAGYGGTERIYWTAGGHYVAFTDTKYDSGEDDWYFYCKDSGGRNHDGWYSYKKHMRGVVSKVWIVKKIGVKEPESYDGEYPNPKTEYNKKKGEVIGEKAQEVAWTTNTSKANYKGGDSTSAFKKAINRAYPNRSSWGIAPQKGASCDVAVGVVVRDSGIDTTYPRGLDEQKKHLPKSKFSQVSVKSVDALQNGDIFYYNTHTAIFYNGKVKEAGYQNYYMKTTTYASARLKSCGYKVWRMSGTVKATRSYMKKGDSNSEVKKLQKYLNWYGQFGLDEDGIWGALTDKAVVSMQTDFFGAKEADGLVGAKTIEKMKEVKR